MALILIADDDEIVVDIVREALTARGHIVGAVDDGLPVFAIVEAKQPDLVILDCNMPEISGIEALRRIRSSIRCFTTPVLMLTGRQGAVDEEVAMRTGANDYLRKPFDVEQLVFRVEALIEKHEASRQLQVRHDQYAQQAPQATHRIQASTGQGWGQRS